MDSLSNYKSNVYCYFNIYRLPVSTNNIDFDNGICKKCQCNEEFDNLIRTAVHKSYFCFFLNNVLYFIDSLTSEKYLIFSKAYLNYIPIHNVNVNVVFKNYLPLILTIHANKFVHYNISLESILYSKNNEDHYSLNISDKIVSFSTFLTKSPIIGSDIISPLHIIIEMTHSRLEQDTIPLAGFRQKFVKFYNVVSKQMNKKNKKLREPFKDLLEFCQYYFSMRYGATDYSYYIINKLCIVKDNTIKKDSLKALNYKKYVDLFAFSLVLHSLIPLNYDKNVEDYKIITNFITSAIAFEGF